MSRIQVFLVLFMSLVSRVGVAQAPDSLTVGERVRVAHRCLVAHDHVAACYAAGPPTFTVGEIQAIDADTIHVRTAASDTAVAIPWWFVSQVWVSDGTRSNFWAGAGAGLLVGGMLGGMIGSQMEWCMPFSCSPATGLGAGVGAAAGFLLGGMVGAAFHSDRWRTLPPEGVHVSLAPGPQAIGLAASISF